MSIMRILAKFDHVITAPHGAWVIEKIAHAICGVRSIEFGVYGEITNINYITEVNSPYIPQFPIVRIVIANSANDSFCLDRTIYMWVAWII